MIHILTLTRNFSIELRSCYFFKLGPLRSLNGWQRENMHFPRHQNCAIAILEQMERNGVIT